MAGLVPAQAVFEGFFGRRRSEQNNGDAKRPDWLAGVKQLTPS
jgi:hypothetical protein